MSALTEPEFRLKSDEALHALDSSLMPLAEQEGFEVDMQNGVLTVVFEEPSDMKFVVSPNAPVRQIWVSAMAKGYKLDWTPDVSAFTLNGETLAVLVERLTNTFLQKT